MTGDQKGGQPNFPTELGGKRVPLMKETSSQTLTLKNSRSIPILFFQAEIYGIFPNCKKVQDSNKSSTIMPIFLANIKQKDEQKAR